MRARIVLLMRARKPRAETAQGVGKRMPARTSALCTTPGRALLRVRWPPWLLHGVGCWRAESVEEGTSARTPGIACAVSMDSPSSSVTTPPTLHQRATALQ